MGKKYPLLIGSFIVMAGLVVVVPYLPSAPWLPFLIVKKMLLLLPMVLFNHVILHQPVSWRITKDSFQGKDILLPYILFVTMIVFLMLMGSQEHVTYILWSAGLTALSEEYYFRGMLLGALLNQDGLRKNQITNRLILASFIFGMTHLFNLRFQAGVITIEQVLQTTFFGLILGGVYLRSGSLLFPILLHFLLNFTAGFGDSHIALNQVPAWAAIAVAFLYVLLAHLICHPKDINDFSLLSRKPGVRENGVIMNKRRS